MKELVVIAKEAKRQLMPASFKSEEMLKIVEI
jgi:DNA repair protein RecO (recombination protein O)